VHFGSLLNYYSFAFKKALCLVAQEVVCCFNFHDEVISSQFNDYCFQAHLKKQASHHSRANNR
jgi:hypothetical protein